MTKESHVSIGDAIGLAEREVTHQLTHVPIALAPYTRHLADTVGKGLRARLLLICAMDGEDLVDPDAARLAAALELLHLATLVHDDIIDDSPLRRGKASLQAAFGRKIAVLTGDYLLARALELAGGVAERLQTQGRQVEQMNLSMYASLVCLGEIRQHAHNRDWNLSVRRYLSIIRGKTAVLFEAACLGGSAMLPDAEQSQARTVAYKKFGRYLGMLFQMMDDLLDIEMTQEQAKKPILSDLRAGVITLPLIYAMQSSEDLRAELIRKEQIDTSEVPHLVSRIVSAGGALHTRTLCARYEEKALDELEKLSLTKQKRSALVQLLEQAAGRG